MPTGGSTTKRKKEDLYGEKEVKGDVGDLAARGFPHLTSTGLAPWFVCTTLFLRTTFTFPIPSQPGKIDSLHGSLFYNYNFLFFTSWIIQLH